MLKTLENFEVLLPISRMARMSALTWLPNSVTSNLCSQHLGLKQCMCWSVLQVALFTPQTCTTLRLGAGRSSCLYKVWTRIGSYWAIGNLTHWLDQVHICQTRQCVHSMPGSWHWCNAVKSKARATSVFITTLACRKKSKFACPSLQYATQVGRSWNSQGWLWHLSVPADCLISTAWSVLLDQYCLISTVWSVLLDLYTSGASALTKNLISVLQYRKAVRIMSPWPQKLHPTCSWTNCECCAPDKGTQPSQKDAWSCM